MSDFLITGCGRSGTGWAAALFTELGFPCSHEGQFDLASHGPLRGGESSWLAIPYLWSVRPATPILRIVRDPYEVVWSVLFKGFLRDMDEPYATYARLGRPDINTGDWLGRAIRYVALWDEPLDAVPHKDLRVGGEVSNVSDAIRHATGVRVNSALLMDSMSRVGSGVNGTGRPYLPRAVIDMHSDGPLIRKRAERFGY